MRIIEQTAKHSGKWNLQVYTYPDQSIRVITGHGGDYYRATLEQRLNGQTRTDGVRPLTLTESPNLIVQAALIPRSSNCGWHTLEDRDDPKSYVRMTTTNFQRLFELVVSQELKIVNGAIEGEWSFKTLSGYISLEPYVRTISLENKNDDPDALDISDYIPKM